MKRTPTRRSRAKSKTSSTNKADDAVYLLSALEEARKGLGKTSPNPAVGAVVVKNGRIIAAGFHRKAGGPHAEVEALGALRDPAEARGATLYVTLEPCCTHGRTPPCTSAIIRAGIARVVYGATDPNPNHAGRADAILEAAGVEVSSGVLKDDCAALNEAWNKWIATGLPLVTIKAGMSLDGRISSPPEHRWITSAASRRDAMRLRSRHDAILVGGQTVRDDDPQLTVRGIKTARQPLRAIWTKSGNLPPTSRVLTDGGPTRIFRGVSLRACLRQLGREGIQSVLIEGGGRTLGEAIDKNLADQAVFYLAPSLLGGPVPATGGRGVADPKLAPTLLSPLYQKIGPDLRISGKICFQ